MKFFSTIPHAYCITLAKRPEKWQEFERDVVPFVPLKIQKWNAVDGSKIPDEEMRKFNFKIPAKYLDRKRGHAGCTLSHIGIYKDAIKQGHERILVFEDDCYVTNPESFVENIEEAVKELPEDWMFFFLGGREWQISKKIPMYEYVSEKIVRALQIFETHAYVITKEGMETMINLFESNAVQIDNMTVRLQQNLKRSYITNPIYCTQRPGHSDIMQKDQSTHGVRTFMKPRELKVEKFETKKLF